MYTPAEGKDGLVGAKPRELLFVDYWADPSGMERFFSNPLAREAGDRLFSSREESEWVPAPAAFTFQVPTKDGTPARFVGMARAPVRSVEDVTAKLSGLVWTNLRTSRRRGHLSHGLFVRLASVVRARPASNARHNGGGSVTASTEPAEILAIDFWSTLEGLKDHYGNATAMTGLDDALTGPLAVSIWEQVNGFSEW
ncbi:MAG TPA: hypothetical protein VHO95_12030 [Candidatus Dormibacteraeota bacterium]|nr:hypothetical protein [Candidatus Dormibacteraeota bacterium]